MQVIHSQIIDIHGIRLETQSIQPTTTSVAPVLIFLHEGLGSVALWRDWPARLCAQLGLPGLVYSRQGYGQSESTPDVRGSSRTENGQRHGRLLPDYMHREALEVLPALLQALGIERPLLLGHSDGGTIALLHASQHPVAGCIVMAPHVVVEDISVQAITAARQAYEQGPLRQRLAPFHANVDCAFWQWNEVWLSDAFRTFDIRPELHNITAPLLAIQGEDDPYGTMAQIDDIAQAVPQAQLLKLPACGHSPHKDQAEVVAGAVQAFVSALELGGMSPDGPHCCTRSGPKPATHPGLGC
ncbi:alpha/beta fold hydrolase [Limnohabitans sp.]|jgi:pimeloyl-ACP methyl ester carboxylesterase